jgi:hypothetical protein
MSRVVIVLKWLRRQAGRTLRVVLWLFMIAMVVQGSVLPPADKTDRVRTFTRQIEFDFVGWTLDALRLKTFEAALGTGAYLGPEARKQAVEEYLGLVAAIQETEAQINQIYADPQVQNARAESTDLRVKLENLQAQRKQTEPLAEAILQNQVSVVVGDLGLTLGGQPVPPVMYHMTPLPLALIISPREVIRQDENIPLVPDLPVDEQASLEERIDRALNVSSLVVEIGGVGTYPTMIYQTRNLDTLSEIIGHEWTHNFLELRPLGVLYLESTEMRIINETVASIAGKEIGRVVLERYYPELLPPPASPSPSSGSGAGKQEPPAFDFRKEMNITRVKADELLAQGKIDEAEAWMEARRQVFWEHGYRWLRKLNQAYFAFYGAYADEPGGEAGTEDPIGAAVRQLRAESPTLSDFLNRISWVTSFEQLQRLVGE